MSRIAEYRMVVAEPSELAKTINHRIAEGWQPYGSPFSHGGLVVQALVRNDGDAEGKRIRKTSVD